VADVTVLGAGVIGLTTAVCLAEAGVTVAVHAAEPPGTTTSAAAGALWGPHLVGDDERIARWAAVTRGVLAELGAAPDATHTRPFVSWTRGVAASWTDASTPPEFAAAAADLATCPPAAVPAGYRSAWRLGAPLISMPGYLDYLQERYLAAGGAPIAAVTYPTLSAAAHAAWTAGCRVLVNCSGSAARDLVPDPDVIAVRGQVIVTTNPGINTFFVGTGPEPGDLTYLFPHRDRVVLGGTELAGNWSRVPDAATAKQIRAACTAIEPALGDTRVLAHLVGLRPVRPRVRLEAEPAYGGLVIVHNYGHGGSGVTLSWGCAQDAATLALAAL
jgi:D-amino-acid oxidase